MGEEVEGGGEMVEGKWSEANRRSREVEGGDSEAKIEVEGSWSAVEGS